MSFIIKTFTLMLLIIASQTAHASADTSMRVLLFGDSIIAGYGLRANQSVPAQLEQLLKADRPDIEIINGGVSGDTTAAGRSRLEWTLNKHQPDVVMIALGGNDLLRGIPPHVTKENINAMLATLKSKNIPTILSAVQAPDTLGAAYQQAFNAIYTDTAKLYDVPLYPFLLVYTFNHKDLMQPDGIHPNAKGAGVIAAKLAEYFGPYVRVQ